MRLKFDKQYMKYVFYVSLTAIIILISYNVIFNLGAIASQFQSIISYVFAILTPLIIGVVIAYLLYPLTSFINNLLARLFKMKQKPYLLSVILTYALCLLFVILLIYGIYALISGRILDNNTLQNTTLSMMLASISKYVARYNEIFEFINNKILESGLSIDLKNYINQAINQISHFITSSFSSIFRFSKDFGISVINGILGIFISFYLLKDYDFFEKTYHKIMLLFFSEAKLYSINSILSEINQIISRFIRGQLLDALIVGFLSSIGLTVIGLDFAILIGFTAGLANIIPYAGPIAGAIPAVIVGVLSPEPIIALWAVLVLLIVQQLDSIVIAPKIVGDSTGLHPVFVILAITIGGSLGGIIGMLVSVPIMGIIKLFALKYYARRKSYLQP